MSVDQQHLPFTAVSFDLAGAAVATGVSDETLRRAVNANELIAHYVGRKPVFRAVDLDEWVRSLPTERPERRTA